MKTIRNLLTLAAVLATAQTAPAAVPSTINYQGRLTDSLGVIQTGTKAMSLRIYNAATAGTQLYAETIGNVTVDANGVYSFQFGAAGTSDSLVIETIATTDGATLTYQKALSNTPVLPGTVSVTDGTYSWNEIDGNPGSPATATANVVSGFVVGATVTSGGSGYASPPAVTITGNGTGAAATATVSSGAVSEITITNAGSGYTTGATITIAPPPAPFVINYSGGTIIATYASAPVAGQTITATYRYSANGISGALAAGAEQWLELTVDGVAQSPRQKVLAVPFALNAKAAESLAEQEVVWRPEALMLTPGYAPSGTTLPLLVTNEGSASIGAEAIVPIRFLKILKVDFDFTIDVLGTSKCGFYIVRYRAESGEEVVHGYLRNGSPTSNGRLNESVVLNITVDPAWVYKLRLHVQRGSGSAVAAKIHDVKITANQ